MYSMVNVPHTRQPKMILLTLCLCLSSLVVCEVIDPILASADNWFVSYQGGVLQQSHLDEHEDDFVLRAHAVTNTGTVTTLKHRITHFPGLSLPLSPLLPPPKIA
jgi:hypothetical protein